MTTITIERELLEQALNALLLPCDRWNGKQFLIVNAAVNSVQNALEAPVAAPEKTVKEIMEFVRHYAANTFSSATLEDKIRRSLATPATAPDESDDMQDRVVWKATSIHGDTAHFGVYSAAKAWARSGTVEAVPIRKLMLVPKPEVTCKTCESLARAVMLDQAYIESVPATAPERKPMTDKEIAGAIVRSPDPMAFGKLPAEGWRPMVRLVEAFHDITKLAPTGSELPSKQADQMEVTSQGQVPAWHDAPTVPGIWLCDEGDICYTWTAHNIEILDQFDPGDGLRWYGPIQEDKP